MCSRVGVQLIVILGLDISTSCVGVCLLNDDGTKRLLDGIEFRGCDTLFEKADVVAAYFTNLRAQSPLLDRIVVEEALLGFRAGMSSATTITTLIRFNGIVSFITREMWGRVPEYLSAAHARKLCGIKLQRTGIAGPQKEQVFRYFADHDLQGYPWPIKKNGKEIEWSRDATDAYCIAKAGLINGPVVAVKKHKQAKKPKTPVE